jgi:hypothetical protein
MFRTGFEPVQPPGYEEEDCAVTASGSSLEATAMTFTLVYHKLVRVFPRAISVAVMCTSVCGLDTENICKVKR